MTQSVTSMLALAIALADCMKISSYSVSGHVDFVVSIQHYHMNLIIIRSLRKEFIHSFWFWLIFIPFYFQFPRISMSKFRRGRVTRSEIRNTICFMMPNLHVQMIHPALDSWKLRRDEDKTESLGTTASRIRSGSSAIILFTQNQPMTPYFLEKEVITLYFRNYFIVKNE